MAGLYLGAFSIPVSNSGCTIAVGLLLLSSLLAMGDVVRETLREPLFWLIGGVVCYVLVYQIWPQSFGPGPWSTTWDFLKATFFWLTGYWFWVHRRHMARFMVTYALGFLVQSVLAFPWHHALPALSGRYMVTLGFDHIVCGELAGLAAFVFLLTIPAATLGHAHRLAPWAGLGSLVAGLWSVYLLILTASRSAWVATAVAALLLAAVYMRDLWGALTRSRRLRHAVVAVVIGAGLIGAATAPMLKGRVTPIVQALSLYRQHGESGLHDTSAGMRLRLLLFGAEAWAQRPVFGWGPSTAYSLIERQGLNEQVSAGNRSTSLLNTPLQVLVELGLVGAGLCLIIVFLLVRGVLACRRMPEFSGEVVLTVLAFLVYELVFSLFDVTFFLRGIALILFGAGMAYALAHASRTAETPESHP